MMRALPYEAAMDEDQTAARKRERKAFDHVISSLISAQNDRNNVTKVNDALRRTEDLWMLLLEDLSKIDNALPSSLKARLISIGIWVMKELVAVRCGEAFDLGPLIEINEIICSGLE